jgi:glycine cleavage system H protein
MHDDGTATVGISQYAQDHLGELVYVELPEPGRHVAAGEACAVVESTKAASDVYAPLAGEVIEVNPELSAAPQMVNDEPYESGWLFRLRLDDASQASSLLEPDPYADHVARQ